MELPISKIKRIAKFDPDINLVSQEASVALTFSTESFIKILARASFKHTQLCKRKTIQLKDIEMALTSNSCFDFLDGVMDTFVEGEESSADVAQVTETNEDVTNVENICNSASDEGTENNQESKKAKLDDSQLGDSEIVNIDIN